MQREFCARRGDYADFRAILAAEAAPLPQFLFLPIVSSWRAPTPPLPGSRLIVVCLARSSAAYSSQSASSLLPSRI